MKYTNIIPNPLTSIGFVNFNYNNSNYATSDTDGISSSEVYKNIRSIVAMKNIPDGMYLPALGELGIALENVSYINSKIPSKDNKIDLNTKYMSSTPYYEYNITNNNYSITNTINNIWYVDISKGYISYSGINDNYGIIPFFKYTPFDKDKEDEEDENQRRNELLKEIDPNLIKSTTYGDPYDESIFSNERYFCSNLDNYVSSFLFNYRNYNNLVKISKNNKLCFGDLVFNLPQEIWQVSHINKNISMNYKNYSPYAKNGSYEFDFCIVLPDFDYIDHTYTEGQTIRFKCDADSNDNTYINTKNILIHANFAGIDETDFYPINNINTMKDCVVFEMDNHIYFTENELRNCDQNIIVKFEFYYKTKEGDYSNFMFEKTYYFDIHNLIIYGNAYSSITNNYATIQMIKTNIARTDDSNKYISYLMNPILVKNETPLNLTYYYSTYTLPGIRINRLNESNLNIFSYEMPDLDEPDKYMNLGMKNIYNFFNNGVVNTISSAIESDMTYFYKGYALDYKYGNNDIVFSTKYANISSFLRTYRETDEYGIFNDCIVNSLIGLDTNEVNNIQNNIKQESDNIVKYKVTNLPLCGAKQYIMFTPYNPGNNLLMNSFYLFIANTTDKDVSITIEDMSYTLCKRKTIIIIKKHSMRVYYPALYDYSYKINISSLDNNYETYKVYNLFSLASKPNNMPSEEKRNISVVTKELYMINRLYNMKDRDNLTEEDFEFMLNCQTLPGPHYQTYEYELSLQVEYYAVPSRGCLINIDYTKDYDSIINQFNFWEEE